MKNYRSYLLIASLLLTLTACESFVTNIPEAKLPQAESKLVVNSVISPQLKYITVIVTESVPLFSKSEAKGKRLSNAIVKISDGMKETIVPYDSANNLYSLEQIKFPVTASKTYTLSVSDGKRSVTAQCSVPAGIPTIASYEFDTLVFDNASYKDTALTLKLTWKDIPLDTNQYRVNAVAEVEYNVLIKDTLGELVNKRISYPFAFNWNWQQGKNEFQSDNHQDGALFTSPIGKMHLPEVREENRDGKKIAVYPNTRIRNVVMEIFNVDKHYYKYYRSLEARNNADNPFAEPTTIYSNVVGGFGCFAAYSAGQFRVSIYK